MNMKVRLGSLVLILIYSLALLLIGDSIGMRWRNDPLSTPLFALLGAALMVIHDTCNALICLWPAARWTEALKNKNA